VNPVALLWIALGGATGSVARALVGWSLQQRPLWATIAVNIAGSGLLGWLMAREGGWEPPAEMRIQAGLAVGFCGGFTTFSTFSWQTLDQAVKGHWGVAAVNAGLSVIGCVGSAWLGFRLGRG